MNKVINIKAKKLITDIQKKYSAISLTYNKSNNTYNIINNNNSLIQIVFESHIIELLNRINSYDKDTIAEIANGPYLPMNNIKNYN